MYRFIHLPVIPHEGRQAEDAEGREMVSKIKLCRQTLDLPGSALRPRNDSLKALL